VRSEWNAERPSTSHHPVLVVYTPDWLGSERVGVP
jgi:hypothetical protein